MGNPADQRLGSRDVDELVPAADAVPSAPAPAPYHTDPSDIVGITRHTPSATGLKRLRFPAGSQSRSRLGIAALVCLAFAWSMLAQGWGANQDSHYALVRAFANHTPTIDRTRFEVGDVQVPTPDISIYRDHYYSNKAPGFAFVLLPAYRVMEAAGKARPVHDTTTQLWLLGLWGLVVPGFVLLVLVRKVAEEIEPGFGTAAAVTLGLATMIFPFSTLLFSHVFSALLGFAAFTVLWVERKGPPRLGLAVCAGFLAGFAITTEFPNALTAVAVGCYAIARPERLRRAAAYASGVLAGILPLLAYNWWAFDSPFHLSYSSTVGFGSTGSYFLTTPSFRRAVEVLFAPVGLLRLTPVVAMAALGVVILYRRYRAEALLIGGVTVAYLFFEASYVAPLGGASPGPRQLVPILPFTAVAFATAFRRFPFTTLALAIASAVEIVALTLTRPLSASVFGDWFHRFGIRDFSETALGLAGEPRRDGIYLLLAAVVASVVLAALATARPVLSWREAATGASVFGVWVLIERHAPKLLNGDEFGKGNGAWTTLLFCAALVFVAVIGPRIVIRSKMLASRERPRDDCA